MTARATSVTRAGSDDGADRSPRANLDADEVARFDALASQWWDPDGPARPLHKLNPARLAFIRERAIRHWRHDPRALRPLEGLRALDIGCGGGLVSEPLARMGARVLGIDAGEEAIAVARAHARTAGLNDRLSYRHALSSEIVAEGERFDLVCCLELIEHVPDPAALLADARALTRQGGLFFFSTLNRSACSYAAAILAAEYLLRWVPPGTHDWERFIRPDEMRGMLREAGFETIEMAGLSYQPLADRFRVSGDLSVNYIGCAR